jgi:hypothetical protein
MHEKTKAPATVPTETTKTPNPGQSTVFVVFVGLSHPHFLLFLENFYV